MIIPHKGQERTCFKTRVGTYLFFSSSSHIRQDSCFPRPKKVGGKFRPPHLHPQLFFKFINSFPLHPPPPLPLPSFSQIDCQKKRRGIGSDLARRPRPAPTPALPHIIAQKLGRGGEKNVWEIGSFWENVAKENSLALMKIQGEMLLPDEKFFFC